MDCKTHHPTGSCTMAQSLEAANVASFSDVQTTALAVAIAVVTVSEHCPTPHQRTPTAPPTARQHPTLALPHRIYLHTPA